MSVTSGARYPRVLSGTTGLMRVARPRSEMQPLFWELRKMFEAFMFPWTSFPLECAWI